MNRSSVILIAFFTALFTAAGTAYLLHRVLDAQQQPQQRVVPSLIGLAEADARANIEAIGLVMMVGGREPNADAQPATVIRQSLPSGHRVPSGQPVSVTLAAAMPTVPDVSGRAVKDATQLLEAAGYTVQVGAAVPSDKVAKGMVVSQSPQAGTALEAKRSVILQPSAGPEAVEVPKAAGLNYKTAETNIKEAGLKLGRVQWVQLAETTSYLVLRQSPKAGEQAAPGSAVDLVVNRGD